MENGFLYYLYKNMPKIGNCLFFSVFLTLID